MVQRYLTSPQLVFAISCRGIAAALINYLGKALGIRLGLRATDSRRPTPVHRLRCARKGATTVLCRTLITTFHLRGYGRRPPSSDRPIGAPTNRTRRLSFSANHHTFQPPPTSAQPPVIIDRTADDSHVLRPGDPSPSRQSDHFLGLTLVDVDDLAF